MNNVLATSMCLAAFAGIAHGLGAMGRRWLPSRLPNGVYELAGLGLLSLAGFTACAVGFTAVPLPAAIEFLSPQPVLASLFALAGAFGCLHALWQRRNRRQVPATREGFAVRAALIALLSVVSLWILLPPFLTDEALYHLTMPLQYLRHGGLTVIEGHGNSAFPAFGEMLGFWALACGNISAARGVQWLVFCIGVRALPELLAPMPRRTVLWGCLLMSLTPVVLCILPTSHIDVLQGVYSLVAVLCLRHYGKHADPPALWLGGFLTGCAAACKYLALAMWPLAMLLVLLCLRRWEAKARPLPRAHHVLLALLAAIVPVAPWLVRNLMIWGNPVFPFLLELFPGPHPALAEDQRSALKFFMEQFGPADGETQLFGWRALVRLPVDLFTAARFDRLQFDGVIGPLAPLTVTAAVWARWRAPRQRPLLPWQVVLMGGFFAAVWLSTSWQMRFLITPYWAICLWAPAVWQRFAPGWRRRGVAAVLVGSVLWVSPAVVRKLPALDVRMLGGPSAMHALRVERLPGSRLCDVIAAAGGGKTMLVWAQRLALWCDVELLSESYDEAASLNAWLDSPSHASSVAALQAHDIAFVLINEVDFLELPPSGVGPEEGARLQRIFARYHAMQGDGWQEVARQPPYVLYRVAQP